MKQELQNLSLPISKNEYEVIANVLKRLNVDDLITSGDYFEEYESISFRKYFEYQPQAITAMSVAAMSKAAPQGIDNAVKKFIESLEHINKIAVSITEDRPFFAKLVALLYELEKAKNEYENRYI